MKVLERPEPCPHSLLLPPEGLQLQGLYCKEGLIPMGGGLREVLG